MVTITLPDGSQKVFPEAISVMDVAKSIGTGLAKAALAGVVDGELVDTSSMIAKSAQLQIITRKDPEGLAIIRHSTAHLMAQAAKQLFPSLQITIGPVIENGFYYDFAFDGSFTPDDMATIEKRMRELVKKDQPIQRFTMTRQQAIEHFDALGEHYKVEIIKDIPDQENLSFYQQGDFIDLCRGPHVPSTGHLTVFKLMKIAGAYWRGDSNNEMLQRIYGTAWANKTELADYLYRLEEAQKRDHRKLGKELNWFHLQDEAPGMVFWHPKGWTVYKIIQAYLRDLQQQQGYDEIHTPQILDRSLWEHSGHWDKFKEAMFVTQSENREYAIKPMNCPCHIQVFNQGIKSYRELPLRFAEFGSCHRNEISGSLHGLMRVRNMVQDDGHIFCTEDQIQAEVSTFINLVYQVYADFGFDNIGLKLSTRPEQRVGSDAVWDKAEAALSQALENTGKEWQLYPGEGAFYGPKIEFDLKDCLGRVWQCGTIQVDFSMPERLGAHYIAEEGSKKTPVMLHRAILGSFERFIGILIEHYAGHLPLWLAPHQVVLMTITDRQHNYAHKIQKELQKEGFRVILDLRNEKIGYKIREHTLQRVPLQVILGEKEVDNQQVALRTCQGEDLGQITLEALKTKLAG